MIRINGKQIEPGYFPDGTLLIKHFTKKNEKIHIDWQYENNEEILVVTFLTRHLQDKGIHDIELWMPYVPNARQDRTKRPEDVFTLKYFCEMINALNFSKVHVLDPHSDVTSALLHRVEQMSVKPYVEEAVKQSGIVASKDIIFYPDSGSQKRYSEQFQFPNAFGIKQRDWETGEIKGLEVSGYLPKEPFNVLIIDDISSFGGTFYFSALKLKALGADQIDLYITHCENSILEGKLMEGDLIRHIYTTSSLLTNTHEKITVLPVGYR